MAIFSKSDTLEAVQRDHIIPAYSLFGHPAGLVEPRFCHVERIGDRWKLHDGLVEEHCHPHLHQLNLWVSGSGHYFADDAVVPIRPGLVCWIPAGVVHGFRVGAGSEAIVLSMSEDFAREQLAGLQAMGPFRKYRTEAVDGTAADWLLSLFCRMEQEYASSIAGQVECIGALALLALTEILRRGADAAHAETARGGESSLLVRFLSLVEERISVRSRVQDLARELGSTPYLLNRACMTGLGMQASQVMRERQIQEARRLLQYTTLGIAEIGQVLAFDDPAHFARAFRAATGMSPRDWRNSRADYMALRPGGQDVPANS